ncbi:nanoRNase/pAp phosphatase, hydrolyzes c-di-AMP and oligoRNAs [Halogranum amylolyticum]|uniref:NanoRNase/pAp phosphatase, hydrolyzes c-di-AMP and oligoRNAs n=1 Tax=Halogranum amylolyticum TaxID=660520 RepID=A0A1H8U3C9_9EURY|nr:DHH family phosphoesterase [Halogranum amylolyticum]SEO97158.1 nanoRNase/pAp phosphatase, hydrolyzes c-di-AMP and oligoRNAs [Halogranum amylolyticum]
MVSRLVLGCGSVGHDIVERAIGWSGRLHVITDEQSRVTALRDEHVRATVADPTDPSRYPERADIVIVAADDPERNRAAATAAREQFPDALFVVSTGFGAGEETKTAIDAVADRVVDPERTVVDRVLNVSTGDGARRMRKLLTVLRDLEGPLAVVTHDNPDPDAIASALALSRLAESVGVDADACYFGEISHQENRALVNLLDIQMRGLDSEADLDDYDGIALVDHSRPGVNDGLPTETTVDIVIDHHPPRAPVEARFVDLRSDVGATSTLLAKYLEFFGLTPDRTVATALLYGIRVDTKDFTREVSGTDFEAAAFLLQFVDATVLERVETPSMNAEVFETIARAIRNRELQGSALASSVGEIRDRDALAQAAEHLLNMEGITTTLVYGFMDGTVYASGRARGADLDLGETLRDAFDQIGSAGGHADMAGAQIPLGILGDVGADSKQSLEGVVHEIISGRFFETLGDAPTAPDRDIGPSLAFEYPTEDDRGREPPSTGEETVGAGTRRGSTTELVGDPAEGDTTEDDDESDA